MLLLQIIIAYPHLDLLDKFGLPLAYCMFGVETYTDGIGLTWNFR